MDFARLISDIENVNVYHINVNRKPKCEKKRKILRKKRVSADVH